MEDYFDRAVSWSVESQTQTARSRRIAWIAAGVVAAIACFEAVALAMLVPLKTVEPITLLVDRQTGYVQSVDPKSPTRIGSEESLTQAFLAQYVIARESFDRATVAADYRKAALWSGGPVRATYLAMMPASNPASPFNRYPAGTVVAVQVKSVSKLEDGIALVRFSTQLDDLNGRHDVEQPWIATIRYRYVNAPMSFEDRLTNPLGFQVLGYRRDAEAMTNPSSSSGSTIDSEGTGSLQPAPLSPQPLLRPSQTSGVATPRNDDLSHLPMGSPLAPPARAPAR